MAAEEEPSRAVGGCVLAILAAVAVAVVFAVSSTAGVLSLWIAGAVAAWRTARRMSDSRTTPPPRGVAPDSDEAARRRRKKARGVYDPNGVMCTYQAPAEEVTES